MSAVVSTRRYGGRRGVTVTLGLFASGGISVRGDREAVGPGERKRCEEWVRETLAAYDFRVPPPTELYRLLWGRLE